MARAARLAASAPLRGRAETIEDTEQKMRRLDEVGVLVYRPLGAAGAPDLKRQDAGVVSSFRFTPSIP